MKKVTKTHFATLFAAALLTGGVYAVSQTSTAAEPIVSTAQLEHATFKVDKMTCATCPITVKKAMQKVEGVQSVEVDFEAKTATVAFDPSVTTTEAIGAASENAGYPAVVGG